MQSLCTLRNHCRQWPRNTRYQADATPYLGRSSTGWIAPALPGALTRSPRRRGEQCRRYFKAERLGGSRARRLRHPRSRRAGPTYCCPTCWSNQSAITFEISRRRAGPTYCCPTCWSNQSAITFEISRLFFSSIIMWPFPRIPNSASLICVARISRLVEEFNSAMVIGGAIGGFCRHNRNRNRLQRC